MTAHDFKPRLRNQITEVKHCLTLVKPGDDESRNRLNFYLRKMEAMEQQKAETEYQYEKRINQNEYPEAWQGIRDYCMEFYENLR